MNSQSETAKELTNKAEEVLTSLGLSIDASYLMSPEELESFAQMALDVLAGNHPEENLDKCIIQRAAAIEASRWSSAEVTLLRSVLRAVIEFVEIDNVRITALLDIMVNQKEFITEICDPSVTKEDGFARLFQKAEEQALATEQSAASNGDEAQGA